MPRQSDTAAASSRGGKGRRRKATTYASSQASSDRGSRASTSQRRTSTDLGSTAPSLAPADTTLSPDTYQRLLKPLVKHFGSFTEGFDQRTLRAESDSSKIPYNDLSLYGDLGTLSSLLERHNVSWPSTNSGTLPDLSTARSSAKSALADLNAETDYASVLSTLAVYRSVLEKEIHNRRGERRRRKREESPRAKRRADRKSGRAGRQSTANGFSTANNTRSSAVPTQDAWTGRGGTSSLDTADWRSNATSISVGA